MTSDYSIVSWTHFYYYKTWDLMEKSFLASFLWHHTDRGREASHYWQVEAKSRFTHSASPLSHYGQLGRSPVTYSCMELRVLAPHTVSAYTTVRVAHYCCAMMKALVLYLAFSDTKIKGVLWHLNRASWGCKSRLYTWPLQEWVSTQYFL